MYVPTHPLSKPNTFDQNFISSYGPLFMKIQRFKRCPLSNSNIIYQNFMKLGHIVKYHNVFFKFDNGPNHTGLSVVIALCL